MDLTKNKNRARRRNRNRLAKEMRETKVFHEKKIPALKSPRPKKINTRNYEDYLDDETE